MAVLANGLVVLAFFGVSVFCVTYHLLAPWWRSQMGINIMSGFLCEAVLLGLSVLGLWWGPYPGRQLLWLAAFTGFVGVSWWRWAMLIRTQVTAGGVDRRDGGT